MTSEHEPPMVVRVGRSPYVDPFFIAVVSVVTFMTGALVALRVVPQSLDFMLQGVLYVAGFAAVLVVTFWIINWVSRRQWALTLSQATSEDERLVLEFMLARSGLWWWQSSRVAAAKLRARWTGRLPVVLIEIDLPATKPDAIGEPIDLMAKTLPASPTGKHRFRTWFSRLVVGLPVVLGIALIIWQLSGYASGQHWSIRVAAISTAAAFLASVMPRSVWRWVLGETAMLSPGRLDVFQAWRVWNGPAGRERVFRPEDSVLVVQRVLSDNAPTLTFMHQDGSQTKQSSPGGEDLQWLAEVLSRWLNDTPRKVSS